MSSDTNYKPKQNLYDRPISRRTAIAVPLAVAASALLLQKDTRGEISGLFSGLAGYARNVYGNFNAEPQKSFTAYVRGGHKIAKYQDMFFEVKPLEQDPERGVEHLATKANPTNRRAYPIMVGKLIEQLIHYEDSLEQMQDGEDKTFTFAKANVKTHPGVEYPVGFEIKGAKSLDEAVMRINKNK